MHVAAGRTRRGRDLRSSSRSADAVDRRADAAHRPQRPVRLSWHRRRAGSASSRPTSAADLATRAFCCPRRSASPGSRCTKGLAVRWIEDRREHLTASANCREHHYNITVYADRDGGLRGIDCEAIVDSGAYSSYPFSACLEAAQVASILPGPYRMPAYRCRTFSVATNKCPILPYRGVARTGVCFALEIMLDAVAVAAGLEPGEVRLRNLVASRRDAVRQHHQETFRQRRLSASPAARAGRDRRRRPCGRGSAPRSRMAG